MHTAKKKKKRRYSRRKKGSKKKRVRLGLAGKVGAIIIGLGPILLGLSSTINAIWPSIRHPTKGLSLGSAIDMSIKVWINNMGQGFGFGPIFKKENVILKDGSAFTWDIASKSHIEKGVFWPVIGTGFVMMLADKVTSWVNQKRGVNIPGTNIPAIGRS